MKHIFTPGEVRALIAPIFGLSAEDIDSIAIIVKGYCADCGKRDMTSTYDNMGGDIQRFAGLLNDGIDSRMALEYLRREKGNSDND